MQWKLYNSMSYIAGNVFFILSQMSEAYSESCQKSKMELFVKIVNGLKPLTVFKKSSILDAWQGSEYVSLRK